MNYKFKVVLTPIQDPGFDGYTVTVPSLPGIVTHGKTKEEALKMAEEAIALHIEDMVAENEIIPIDFEDMAEITININQ